MAEATVPTVEELLQSSTATEEFKRDVLRLQETHKPQETIEFGAGNPPVKVLRTICGLLDHYPDLTVKDVKVDGRSGCSDYTGQIRVNGGEKVFHFIWNCRWKAEEEGYRDFLGEPDQIRAAQEFGYRCFQRFEETA